MSTSLHGHVCEQEVPLRTPVRFPTAGSARVTTTLPCVVVVADTRIALTA